MRMGAHAVVSASTSVDENEQAVGTAGSTVRQKSGCFIPTESLLGRDKARCLA